MKIIKNINSNNVDKNHAAKNSNEYKMKVINTHKNK